MTALTDPAGYRAAHQYLERQLARLTDDNAALRGLLEQAILRLASATGNPEQVIRCELGAPPRPTWQRGNTPLAHTMAPRSDEQVAGGYTGSTGPARPSGAVT